MIDIEINRKSFPAKELAEEHAAISGFRLILRKNEFVCLVGPSGCGKTTLLNLIAGLDHDFTGKISFDNTVSSPNIGYVFQNPRLLPWRTVRENIELALAHPETAGKNIDSMLAAMQLTRFAQAYPERLSVGMSRRVALIRAFAIDPELLLMDEPFVSLDAASARQVRDLLVKLWQERPHTVLFVTHDLREAIELADRIIFLTPAPMQSAGEVEVAIPRSERRNEAVLEQFRRQLLKDYAQFNNTG